MSIYVDNLPVVGTGVVGGVVGISVTKITILLIS